MSFFHLSKLVGSKEDFADAHEPLNDGVKEVPNAQTVAAGTKTGDVGTDTNSPGPAKVIPEKEDTDDATEKQFDTVKESAETGESKPAPAKSDDSTESKPTPPATKPDEGSKDTDADSGDGATKAPPFVKKDDAEESEAEADEPKLEHDTAEATDAEIKKTESATKSLEDYAQHAGRFDIIGYPRRDQERLRQTIGFINHRAGKPSDVTKLSLECINEAVGTGKARIELLKRQAEIHATRKVSKENYDAVVEQAITTEPTAHGNEPLAPEVAEQLTAVETDPMDLPEVAEIGRIQDAVETLQGAQVAIEQHLQILRSNKRISKQAAAVLQAGLEHIDQICGLKVRATGMEGYLTTPRAAVEDADVNEKSLLDRAGEIGAKIIQFLRELIARSKVLWKKYQSGIASVQTKMVEIKKEVDALKGSPTSQSHDISQVANEYMFIDKEFVGHAVSDEELNVMFELDRIINVVQKEIANPIIATLKSGNVDEETLERIHDILDRHEIDAERGKETRLPGNYVFKVNGPSFSIDKEQPSYTRGMAVIDMKDTGTLRRNFAEIYKFTGRLGEAKQIDTFVNVNEKITQALIGMRSRGKQGMFDEELFQKIQSTTAHITDRYFNLTKYFDVMGALAKAQGARAKVYHWIAAAWNMSYTED